jgi:PAS domain S-box-containing protein
VRLPDDSRELERALLDESAEDLYEHAPCGYLSTLPDGTIVRINQTLLDWLGHSRDAMLQGIRFQALLTIGSKMYYETHYAPLLQMQGFVSELALDLVHADGRVLPVLLNARQRRASSGTPLFNRITVFDATDRRRYERELLLARRKAEQVAKDKADLLAMLSHDIRNPLNALMVVVHLLDGSELTDTQKRFVNVIKSSSQNMLDLLNHILELSKAESSSFALVETPLAIDSLVADVIANFEATAREKGLQLRASVSDAVPALVVGDPVAIRQILTNLVGNAVKFTERGEVMLRVGARERAVDAVTLDVAVSDTGIGIAPDVVERIFNEFTQASYETAMRFGGTGLGLSITRKLLALYGSTVQVSSVPGQGSTFSFRLRLPVPRPQAS